MSHVTGYPARSRDRSCNRHTATATRPLPHSHRYTATATQSPPHGHCHTATATQSPPQNHRHTATATLGRVTCRVMCRVMCQVKCRHLNHGNLTRALGPRALSVALGPLAPTATPSLWPAATLSAWPTPFVNHGRWRPSSLDGPRPLALAGLRPTAASNPWGTLGHDRLSRCCRH